MRMILTTKKTAALLALSVVALTGCADDTTGVAASSDTTTAATESDEPQARLVVAHDGGVVVLDPADELAEIARFDTAERPRLAVASDDRHVYLTQAEEGTITALDTGTYGQTHGDHDHFYVQEPALREIQLSGDRPVHVVSHDGRTAVYFDGTGTAEVFDDAGLVDDLLDTTTVDSGTVHHGVVVPFGDGTLVSEVTGDSPLADTVAVRDADGEEVARHENCPMLHGEATHDDTVAFGCADGVLLVTTEGASLVPNPEGSGDDRVGSLYASQASDVIVGNFGETTLSLLNLANATLTTADVGGAYRPIARGEDGSALTLRLDGVLVGIDPETGETLGTVEAIDAYTIPEGHGQVAPTLAVVGHTAYVTDPAGQRIVAVDTETWTVSGEFAPGVAPAQAVAVNAPAGEAGHDH